MSKAEGLSQSPIDGFTVFNNAWQAGQLEKPAIVLIGGHIGTGKTTFAEETKSRLPYSSLLTTAIIRSVLQSLIPEDQLPELYKHTYDLAQFGDPNGTLVDRAVEGYQTQAGAVDKGLRRLVSFFESEGQVSIIEGNHVLPETTQELESHPNVVGLFFESPEIEVYRRTISGPTHKRTMTEDQFEVTRGLHDHIVGEARNRGQTVFQFGETEAATNYVGQKLADYTNSS